MRKLLLLSGFFCCCLNSYGNVIDSIKASAGCFGSQTYFAAYTDSSITSWQWDLDNDGQFDDGFSQYPIYTFNQPGNFTFSLKAVTVSGNTDTLTNSVIVYPIPLVNFQADNLCAGKAAIYTSTSTITSGTIAQYQWDFNNDGQVDNTSGPVVPYTCGPAQTYSTKLICISDQGCSAFTIKTTTVYEQPVANFSFTTSCVNEPVAFSNTSVINNEIISINLWNFDDGSPVVDNSDSILSHTFTANDSFSVTLITITPNNCKDTVSKNVIANALPVPSFSQSAVTNVACYGSSTGAIDLSVTGNASPFSFLWNTGAITQNLASQPAGNYSVTVTDTNGCSKTAAAVITEPAALLISSDGSANGISVTGGTTPYSYLWSNDSTVQNPALLEGDHTVTVTDAKGCTANYTVIVAVTLNLINDLLTPNADGVNDYFMIEKIEAFSNCDVDIYNVWGDKVFSKSGYKNDWNGTYNGTNGKELPAGSYYYIIKCDDKEQKVGNVNILR